MDPIALAPAVLKILLPFMPSLLNKVGAAAADKAAQFAGAVWDRLRSSVMNNAGAKDAAEKVAAEPQNAVNQQIFQLQLQQLLERDSALQQSINALLQEQEPDLYSAQLTNTGAGVVQIGRDATDSTIVTGDNNRLNK